MNLEAERKDKEILFDLYNWRIMSVEQLARRHNYTKGSMYHKLLRLKNKNLLTTQTIKGFSNESSLRGKVYRITDKGMSYLLREGYDVRGEANTLRVSDMRVPVILTANDLFEEFSSQGWHTLDSRELKIEYNLNRGINLNGMLSSPSDCNYPFYLLLEGVTDNYIKRIRVEIERLNFHNLIFFTKDKDVFQRTFSEMLKNAEVYTYNSFRVMPFGYGKTYLRYYEDFQVVLNYLDDRFGIQKLEKHEDRYYQNNFKTVIEYENNEYYLVSMLDYDLTNLHRIRNYTKERFGTDGRKVLLLSDSRKNVNYEKILGKMDHVEYLYIDVNDFMKYPVI